MEKQQIQLLADPDNPVEEITTVIRKFMQLYPEQRNVILSEVQQYISKALDYYKGVD